MGKTCLVLVESTVQVFSRHFEFVETEQYRFVYKIFRTFTENNHYFAEK